MVHTLAGTVLTTEARREANMVVKRGMEVGKTKASARKQERRREVGPRSFGRDSFLLLL